MPAGLSALTPLANTTLASSASSITFSSIVGTYRDLILVVANYKASTDITAYIRFNSDTGSNYSQTYLVGNGSAAYAGQSSGTKFDIGYFTYASNSDTGYSMIVNVMDYTATDKHKTALIRSNRAGVGSETFATRWASTAAVTAISLTASTGTFSTGTSFALYGVSA
jgi:hypothetical protein